MRTLISALLLSSCPFIAQAQDFGGFDGGYDPGIDPGFDPYSDPFDPGFDFNPNIMPPLPDGVAVGYGEIPDEAGEAFLRGRALFQSGEFQAAIEEYQKSLSYDTSDTFRSVVYNDVAYVYMGMNDNDQALQAARQAVALSEMVWTIDTLGDALRASGNLPEACSNYARACSMGQDVSCSNQQAYC